MHPIEDVKGNLPSKGLVGGSWTKFREGIFLGLAQAKHTLNKKHKRKTFLLAVISQFPWKRARDQARDSP
jgi:hypothetical protein